MPHRRLPAIVVAAAAAETLFWLYTFSYIGARANPKGDGMEWLAAVPMTLIFVVLVLPAFAAAALGWRFALAGKIALGFAVVAAIADAVVWTQIVGELAGRPAY